VRFAELNSSKVKNIKCGGKHKSKNGEIWAANASDEWRKCHGYNTKLSITDLSEQPNLHKIVDMLLKFTLQVRKQDWSLYPPKSRMYS
jgi:hypothetical protein